MKAMGIRRCPATVALIGVNLAVFAAVMLTRRSSEPDYLSWGSNWTPMTIHQPWRLLTAAFLHRGALELTLTCLALWIVGRWAEQLLGSRFTVLIYLSSAAVGSIILMWTVPEYQHVGAGPAVVGLDLSIAGAGIFGTSGAVSGWVQSEAFGKFLSASGAKWSKRSLALLPVLILAFTQQHGIDIPAQVASGMAGLVLGSLFSRWSRVANESARPDVSS